jgi:pimeloyl-ACP methyl ester carboxylesterase
VSSLAFPNPPRDWSAAALRREPGLVWLTAAPSGFRIPAVFLSPGDGGGATRTRQNSKGRRNQRKNPSSNGRPVILYSHGNAEDLGIILPYLKALAQQTQCDVLGYEYPGYGLADGQNASEKLCYQAIEAAYDYLVNDMGITQIVAFGRSLGSGPTVHLCANVNVTLSSPSTVSALPPASPSPSPSSSQAQTHSEHGTGVKRTPLVGCILQSPLTSAIRCVMDSCSATVLYPFDIFVNASKVERIPSPVLILHGLHDDVVPPQHGRQLYDLLQHNRPALPSHWHYPPVWVPGCGHNDMPDEYCLRHCRQFVDWILEVVVLPDKDDTPEMATHGSTNHAVFV